MTERDKRLIDMAALAVKAEREKGYPPELLLAQWAAESKWGETPSGRNNLFGMTYVPARHEDFDWVPTTEELSDAGIAGLDPEERATISRKVDIGGGRFKVWLKRRFASYPSVEASVDDKVWLIQHGKPYAAAWNGYLADRNLEKLTRGVAKVYATAEEYGNLLVAITRQSNVLNAIAAARKAA